MPEKFIAKISIIPLKYSEMLWSCHLTLIQGTPDARVNNEQRLQSDLSFVKQGFNV